MRNQRRHSSHHRLYVVALAAAALLAIMISQAVKPQPASANGGLTNQVSTNADGSRIAFVSEGSLTGGGPATTKEFLFTAMTPPACNPTFAAPANFQIGSRPFSVVVSDFNGDGLKDL